LLTSGIIIGIGIDVRQRREAEEKLRESESRLQVIFDNAAIGIVEVDSDNRFIAVNERSCEILGYSREELINKSIEELTAPEDRNYSNEMNARLTRGEMSLFDYEKRYIKKNGSLLWVHVTVSAIRDSHGRYINSIGTFEDISKRKEVEQALRESEEMFAKLFQSIPVGIALSTSSENAYFKVNSSWLEIFDFENEQQVIGKNSLELGLIPDQGNREKILREFGEKGYVRDAELTFITRKGRKKIVSINMDLITIRSEKYILAANTDITDRKNAENAVRKSETVLKHAAILTNLGAWEIEYDSQIDVMKNPLRWSDQVYRIFGYPPGSVLVNNDLFYSHVHPDDRQKTKDALALAINENTPFIIEHRIIRADGNERIVIEHADILFDESGNISKVIGAVQDITERKQEEQKLKDSEEKFRSLFENITEGVAMHELVYKDGKPSDYRIIGINPAFSEITGLNPAVVTNLLASEVYQSDPPPFLEDYALVATTGKPMRFDTFYPPMSRHFVISAISPKKTNLQLFLKISPIRKGMKMRLSKEMRS
jgi:PAS domain S-box-containing protein